MQGSQPSRTCEPGADHPASGVQRGSRMVEEPALDESGLLDLRRPWPQARSVPVGRTVPVRGGSQTHGARETDGHMQAKGDHDIEQQRKELMQHREAIKKLDHLNPEVAAAAMADLDAKLKELPDVESDPNKMASKLQAAAARVKAAAEAARQAEQAVTDAAKLCEAAELALEQARDKLKDRLKACHEAEEALSETRKLVALPHAEDQPGGGEAATVMEVLSQLVADMAAEYDAEGSQAETAYEEYAAVEKAAGLPPISQAKCILRHLASQLTARAAGLRRPGQASPAAQAPAPARRVATARAPPRGPERRPESPSPEASRSQSPRTKRTAGQ